MIGQTIRGRYQVTAHLGQGGMGTVYRATDTPSGRQVAVKVLDRERAASAQMLERFRREGEALRQLRHPNIVNYADAFDHDGQSVIVMEYVPGGSLADVIGKGPLSLDSVRQMTLDVCDALTRAHRLNVVHRDLKPANILIAQDGTLKLSDFGIARLVEQTRLTRTGMRLGTPYYMSPEAWQGKPLDAQADIWSLGVVLFEMLTGHVPFKGDTPSAVMASVLTMPTPDVRKLRPDVPAGMSRILVRMLSRDRSERYASVREVAADLEQGGVGPSRAASQRWMRQPAVWGPIAIGLPLAGLVGAALILGLPSRIASLALGSDLIAFSSSREGNYELYLMGAVGSEPTRLTRDGKFAESPAWSPDGDRIAFAGGRDGNSEIYVLTVPDAFEAGELPGVIRLTDDSASDGDPAWSPDGGRIAFVSNREGNQDVYVMNADGSGVVNLTQSPAAQDRGPAWSPDGRRIAFDSDRGGNQEIYSMNADGSAVIRLTLNFVPDSDPAWSPDGDRIAFVCERGGNLEICVIDLDESGPVNLTNDPSADMQPAWSADGQHILYTSDRDGGLDIFILDAGAVLNGSPPAPVNLTKNELSYDRTAAWRPLPASERT